MSSETTKDEFDLGQRQTLLMMKAFLCSETLFFVALIIVVTSASASAASLPARVVVTATFTARQHGFGLV